MMARRIQNVNRELLRLCAVVLLIFACDKFPVGYDQFDRGDIDSSVTFVTARRNGFGSYGKYNVNGPGDRLVLGKNHAYESRILLRFAISDSAVDSASSVTLTLYPERAHRVPFRIFPTTTEWDDFQANWHDAKTGEPWFTPGGDYDTTKLIASGVISADSTMLDLDTNQLRLIVNAQSGLVLLPQIPDPDSSFLTSLYSMSTSGKKPKIVVRYARRSQTYEATQNTYIVDTLGLNLRLGKLWAGSGYVFRTYLKFNTDSLDSLATIVTAEMTVRADSLFSNRETLMLGVHRLTQSYELNQHNAAYDAAVVSRRALIAKSDSAMRFDLRPLVQFWAQKPDSNFGLLLTMEPEAYDVSRVEFKPESTGVALRIGYTRPPHGRYRAR